MILAIDAGNTNIVLGCLEEDGSLRFTARVSTDRGKTMDEYALILRSLFDLHGIDRRGLEGAILASVVSELTEVLRTAVELVIHQDRGEHQDRRPRPAGGGPGGGRRGGHGQVSKTPHHL